MTLKPAYILLPLAGLLAFDLFAQKSAAGKLSYFIHKLGLKWDGGTPIVQIDMQVQNPSNQQFIIKSIVASAFSNGNPIGNISTFQTVVISPNSQQIVPVLVRLNAVAVVSDLLSLIQKGSGNPQELTIEGYVNANGFVSPLNLTYKIM